MERLDYLNVTVVAEDSVLYESPYLGQHGISLCLQAGKEGYERSILMDVGQNSEALLYNMRLLEIDPASIDAIVITHCHYDHTQGLVDLLKAMGRQDVPVVAHPDLFRLNFIVSPWLRHVGVMNGDSKRRIEENGGTLFLTSDPLQLLPGLTTSGQVRRRTDFEEVGIALKTIDDEQRVIEDTMADDISLYASVGDAGLVVMSGCSHAGIVNITAQGVEYSGQDKVASVIGGLHLVEAPADRIAKTAAALEKLGAETVYAGHCTGFAAQAELRGRFGQRFTPLQTGMKLSF